MGMLQLGEIPRLDCVEPYLPECQVPPVASEASSEQHSPDHKQTSWSDIVSVKWSLKLLFFIASNYTCI